MEEPKNEETIKPEKSEKVETSKNWLDEEVSNLSTTSFNENKKPALKLEENKIKEITVDFSKPFDKWVDEANDTVKKIIPVTCDGDELVWWLNVKNPIYAQIVQKGLAGEKTFKILQTGTQQNTKYTLIE